MNSYDFLKYLTVNLSAKKLGEEKGACCATGFYAIIDNKEVLVTAKHFTENTESTITITAHYKERDTVISLPITAYIEWDYSQEYDIAFCEIKPLKKKLKEIKDKDMFFTAIQEKNIVTKDEFNKINILSEILTIGYPGAISSTHHEFPLFKKGYISSATRDFAEDGKGYLDLSAEGGFSGAPVLLNNSELKLIGVLIEAVVENDTPKSTSLYISADKILQISKENKF